MGKIVYVQLFFKNKSRGASKGKLRKNKKNGHKIKIVEIKFTFNLFFFSSLEYFLYIFCNSVQSLKKLKK